MSRFYPYQNWLADIRSGKPISYSRYGDGEMYAVIGNRTGQKNCDGHDFFPELGSQLKQILISNPKYRLGLLSLSRKMYASPGKWMVSRQLLAPLLNKHNLYRYTFYNAEVWNNAYRKGQTFHLCNALRTRNVFMVGPEHLLTFNRFRIQERVTVPKTNCFLSVDKVYEDIVKVLDANSNANFLVSLSAGMTSCLLVDRLYKSHGHLHSFIDFGSLWDPFAGVLSRNYMHKHK